MRRIALPLLSLILLGVARAESPSATPPPNIVLPENGFVSPRQYTNAFFGFILPLSQKGRFQILDLSEDDKPLHHFLFAQRSSEKLGTTLVVSATEVVGAIDDEAEKAVFIPGPQADTAPEALSIGGRLFWKSEVEQKTFSNKKLFRLRYATGVPGFVIQFSISSFDRKIAEDLRASIESIKFFDPSRTREMIDADSSAFLPEAVRRRLTSAPHLDLAQLDGGEVLGTVYANRSLGFSYHFAEGWQTGQEGPQRAGAQNPSAKNTGLQGMTTLRPCTRVLASAMNISQSREEFHPRITILAADPACFVPDLTFPTSVRERSTVEAFGRSVIRAFSGTSLMGKAVETMRAVETGGQVFLEVPSAKVIPISGSLLQRKIHMIFVLTSIRHCWVIWLFESDTQSELDKLMKTSLVLAQPQPAANPGHH